jgi:hypothetical protein
MIPSRQSPVSKMSFRQGRFATAVGEDRGTADQACSLLLVIVGGESSHAAVVWENAAQDRGAADAIGLATTIAVTKSVAEGGGSEKCLRNGFEKSNFVPWDLHVTAEEPMQSRTWLER